MLAEKVAVAMTEAKRFLERAKAYQEFMKSDPGICGSKQGGALRRASMDLTRALADLRRNPYQVEKKRS